MASTRAWAVGTGVSVVVLLVAFFVVLWKLGLFTFAGTEAGAKIVASVIALAGALIGSIVTIVGVFLRHSLDQRNTDLREQAEKRLAQEAVIQAVQSLSTSSGSEVPMTQRAGVLFALANLGQTELAVTMLGQMLQADRIDAYSASCLIDRALRSENEGLQHEASVLLLRHATAFLEDGGHASFPECLLYCCNTQLPADVRENGTRALLELVLARPCDQWHPGVLGNLMLTLVAIWQDETEPDLKNGVALCLSGMVGVYPKGKMLYSHHAAEVQIDSVKEDLRQTIMEAGSECADYFRSRSRDFEVWARPSPDV